MLPNLDRSARVLAAGALLGIAVAMMPVPAAAAPQVQTAQAAAPSASPPASAAPKAKRRSTSSPERVEARIKSLHDQLKITDAETPQWNAFAQVMRDNATAMRGQIDQRRQGKGKMSAIDDLRSYRQLAQAHVEGLDRLIPAFQALYDTMPDDQKKNADAVFGKFGQRRARGQK